MLWLTWRQFRPQAAVVFGLLAVIAVALAVTCIIILVHLYDTTVKSCASHGDCGTASALFTDKERLLQQLGQVVLVAPSLIGILLGAPLVARERENHTFRLAWTQSVSRTRWRATKLGLVDWASIATAGLMSLMVTWWSSPFDRIADSPFSPSYFDRRDLVPIGYAAFAFALGVTVGVLIRRTLPAMAATLVAFVGSVGSLVLVWVRPHLIAPIETTTAFFLPSFNGSGPSGPVNPADWVLSEETINGAGRVIGQNGGFGPNGGIDLPANGQFSVAGQACPASVPVPRVQGPRPALASGLLMNAIQECLEKLHIREVATFQPASRYWAFQWYETAIFLGLALFGRVLLLAGPPATVLISNRPDRDRPTPGRQYIAQVSNDPTLFEWAGGRQAFDRLINAFYDRVEQDESSVAFLSRVASMRNIG